MVNFFVCFGYVDEVEVFFFSLLFKGDYGIWKFLFIFCEIYKDFDVVVRVVEYCLNLKFDDFLIYIILFNIYVIK